MTDKNWPDLITTAPVVPFEGRLVRCIPQLTYEKGDPPSYLFTSGMVNRCNPEGVSCIYMGEDRDTADCEYRSYYEDPEPQLTFFADFKARSIIDLGDKATREHFGFTDADFFTGFRLKTDKTALQALGEALSQQKGIVAIRFPSHACHREKRSGFNMVIFPAAIEAPDAVKILGRKGATLEEWP
jgi:RES domain-containing protein